MTIGLRQFRQTDLPVPTVTIKMSRSMAARPPQEALTTVGFALSSAIVQHRVQTLTGGGGQPDIR